MERIPIKDLSNEEIVKGVMEEVEEVRADAERRLKKSLSVLGAQSASAVANYFFGHHPNIEQLTVFLLKDIGALKPDLSV